MPWGLSCSASLLCVWNKDHNCAHCCTWRFLTVLISQTCVVYLHEKEVPPSVGICEEQNHHPPDMQSPLGLKLERVLLWLGSFFGHDKFGQQVWTLDTQVFCFLVHWPEFDHPFPSQFCLMHPGAMGTLSLETRIVIWCETINTNVLVDKVQKIS
jgi:hypothetical protein